MDGYLRQRLPDWEDPKKRAAYLRDDAEQVRLLMVSAEIRKRHAAMLATYVAEKPAPTRRRRSRSTIWRR